MANFFRGTSIDQDSRFFNQDKKLLASMSFPASFDERVDLAKVQLEVVNQWAAERLTQLLGFEDDIVVAMVVNLLEPKAGERLDPRRLQVALTGFLAKDAAGFTRELWDLLLSAQANPTGIPAAILDRKKRELEQAAAEKAKLRQVLDAKRAEADASRRGADNRQVSTVGEKRQAETKNDVGAKRETEPRGRPDGRSPADRSADRERVPRREPRRSRSPVRPRRSRSPVTSHRPRGRGRSPSRSRSRPRARRDRDRSEPRSRTRGRRSPPRRREPRRRRSPSPHGRRRSRSRSPSSSSPSSASSASSASSRRSSPPRRRHRNRPRSTSRH